MDNEECKIRLQVINIDSNEPSFYPFSVKINKCSGSCNNATDDTYAKLCVYDVVKNINVKLFNLVPRTNETRHIEWHEPCKLNVDQLQVIKKMINNAGIIINVDVNAKN